MSSQTENPIIPAVDRFLLLSGLLVCFFVAFIFPLPQTQACTICVPFPEKTLADRLLEFDEIIFAREVENSPYLFAPVATLKGAGPEKPIKVFCDSSTRRKLQFIPGSVVVLVRQKSAEDWRVITFADNSYQPFIRAIVEQGGDWSKGSGNQARLHYFSELLTSEHPLIQEQAYLEIGRAPYSTIKTLAPAITTQEIYEFLGNFRFIEWHSLYILFLGQSNRPEDRAHIREQVESGVRFSTTINLAAWLTAFVEAYPESAIDEIETWYFSNPGRTEDELEQVMTSFSVLGSQQPIAELPLFPLRDEIVASYGTLLNHHPIMAGRVARDLAMWQVNAHVDQLTIIRKEMVLSPSDAYLLDNYLSMAGSFPSPVPEG